MKQITISPANIGVQDAGDGNRALIITDLTPTGPGEVYIIPMSAEVAQQIGNQMSAPHIVVAQPSALKVVGG